MDKDGINKKTVLSFALYDWAASPLPTLHSTFIFAVYFTTVVMPQGGTVAWGWMTALASIAVAVIAPFSGALADRWHYRKPILFLLTLIAGISGIALWWVAPDQALIPLALIASGVLIFALELSFVFYNALLPSVSTQETIGRISGFAWGFGYISAIVALIIALGVFVLPDTSPFGLNHDQSEHIRITMPFAALWLMVFVIPFFLYVPEPKASSTEDGSLAEGWRIIRQTPGMLRFIITRMIYADALVTLFAFGGIFAATVFGFSQIEVLIFAIILNITAGLGAILGGVFDDRMGAIKTIRLSLIAMIVLGGIILMTASPLVFWVAASVMGIFIGPLQSASRSHLSRMAPEGAEARVFSFMMLTGKSTSFLGPLCYGWVVWMTGEDRYGMVVVSLLLIIGLILLKDAPADGKHP